MALHYFPVFRLDPRCCQPPVQVSALCYCSHSSGSSRLCQASAALPLYQLHLGWVSAHPVLTQIVPDLTLLFHPYFFLLSFCLEQLSLTLLHPPFLSDSPAKFPCLCSSIIFPTYLSVPVFLSFPYSSPVSLLLFLLSQDYASPISEGSKKHLSDIKLFPRSCQVPASKSRDTRASRRKRMSRPFNLDREKYFSLALFSAACASF